MKLSAQAEIVKLLCHKRMDRGMVLIEETSRCVRRNDIHEIVTTDQASLRSGSRVDRVGFLGFAEFRIPGVVEVGDEVSIGSHQIGTVVGFDQCHFPNHYNIIIHTEKLMTANDVGLRIGDAMHFAPPSAPAPAPGTAVLPPSVIVGFGHAGRNLHFPCILKTRALLGQSTAAGNPVFVVDPFADPRCQPMVKAPLLPFHDLEEIPENHREEMILHLCTPPDVRCALLGRALELGFRRFILEKPMVLHQEDLTRIEDLQRRYQAEIVVVSNWMASALTAAVEKQIENHGRIVSLRISQKKGRIARSLSNGSHASAFDVELPHMIALSLLLLGESRLVDARCWDLESCGRRAPHMGGAEMTLESAQGVLAHLHSDLMAPLRERRLQIDFADGSRLEGFYPCDSSDHFSQLFLYDPAGPLRERHFFEDDTLTRYLAEAYAYFTGLGAPPRSTFGFHLGVCSLLIRARQECVAPKELQEERL